MNTNKISAYIGFAVKKGAVVYGIDTIEQYHKKMYLIITSNSVAQNTANRTANYAQSRNCPLVTVDNLEDILKRNCKVLAICDKSLADAIQNNLL